MRFLERWKNFSLDKNTMPFYSKHLSIWKYTCKNWVLLTELVVSELVCGGGSCGVSHIVHSDHCPGSEEAQVSTLFYCNLLIIMGRSRGGAVLGSLDLFNWNCEVTKNRCWSPPPPLSINEIIDPFEENIWICAYVIDYENFTALVYWYLVFFFLK